jgi:hypothetical protein
VSAEPLVGQTRVLQVSGIASDGRLASGKASAQALKKRPTTQVLHNFRNNIGRDQSMSYFVTIAPRPSGRGRGRPARGGLQPWNREQTPGCPRRPCRLAVSVSVAGLSNLNRLQALDNRRSPTSPLSDLATTEMRRCCNVIQNFRDTCTWRCAFDEVGQPKER